MKLKKCPFCARQPKVHKFIDNIYTIICECGAESPNDSVSENGAIRIWNRRRLEKKDHKGRMWVLIDKRTGKISKIEVFSDDEFIDVIGFRTKRQLEMFIVYDEDCFEIRKVKFSY